MVIQVIKNISYIKRNTSQVLYEFSMSKVLIASYRNICATWFGRFHFKCCTNQAVIADDITSQAFTMFSFVVRTTSISICLFFFFKQKTAYEILSGLVGSEMCIRDSSMRETVMVRLVMCSY